VNFPKKFLYSLKKNAYASLPFDIEPESEEFEEQEQIILYRCGVCGYLSKSVGFLHGHMESHTPWYSTADVSQFMDWTEKLEINDYNVTSVEDYKEENM